MLKSTSFIFDGVSSETYGLMIYFMDDESTKELPLGTDVDMIEDRLPKNVSPIHYGVDMNKAMTFPLTFGSTEYLEDYDVDAILSWLTGHQQYKWLEFVDGDHYVRYKCHLNNMKSLYINGLPFAFTCDVECDGQFGYEYPVSTEYLVDSNGIGIDYFNRSAYNGYLYPDLNIVFGNDCNTLSIINESDNNREFKINYFDRSIVETNASETSYETSFAKEIENDIELNRDYLSWSMVSTNTDIEINEIIIGDNIWVALPRNSDIALYSEDNGATWNRTTLPYSGGWTGCYGDNGFVAICIDEDTAVASYSQTGIQWSSDIIDLPFAQRWNRVRFVESTGISPAQYVAVGGPDSAIAAISATGWSWTSVSLPRTQEWRDVCSGNGRVLAIGGNSNYAAISNDCIDWVEIELPQNATWTTSCYGNDKFIMLADTLYGSGVKNSIGLYSSDGKNWDTMDIPLGAWEMSYYKNNKYIALGDRQITFSSDGIEWFTSTIPVSATSICSNEQDNYICALGSNKYLLSSSSDTVNGNFKIQLTNEELLPSTISEVYIYAEVSPILEDTSFASNGDKLLSITTPSENTGGDFVAVTTDLRYGSAVDGALVSAQYDSDSGGISISYIVDTKHLSLLTALFTIRVEYTINDITDLGYDGLVVDIDNKNQIITTNKDTLNLYEYFNKKFFRLVKGMNHLTFKTDGGSCYITMNCEFLRKVGGK